MLCIKSVTAVFYLVCAGTAVPLQGAVAESAKFSDLEWLVGVWRGQNGVDQIENVYLPTKNNEIVATFTATVDAKVTRYELLSYREEGGKILRREVAFDPGLVPAAPVPAEIISSTDATHIRYGESEMVRTGDNTMTVTVTLHPQNSPVRIVRMNFTRVLKFTAP